jgi:hypothetical protein
VHGSRSEISYTAIQRELYESFRDNVLINRDLEPSELSGIDLWQYGQHHGLPSPLLDWTSSPYIALFFALIDEDDSSPMADPEPRCVWALNLDMLKLVNYAIRDEIRPRHAKMIKPEAALQKQFPELEVINNIDGYNKRLAYQQGFFTKHTFYESLEIWAKRIAEVISHNEWDTPLLTRVIFRVSDEQRGRLLRTLDKMNINSRSLFPDIRGSVDYARFSVEHRRSGTLSFHGTRSPEPDKR